MEKNAVKFDNCGKLLNILSKERNQHSSLYKGFVYQIHVTLNGSIPLPGLDWLAPSEIYPWIEPGRPIRDAFQHGHAPDDGVRGPVPYIGSIEEGNRTFEQIQSP